MLNFPVPGVAGYFIIMSFDDMGKGGNGYVPGFAVQLFFFLHRDGFKCILEQFGQPLLGVCQQEDEFDPFGFVESGSWLFLFFKFL